MCCHTGSAPNSCNYSCFPSLVVQFVWTNLIWASKYLLQLPLWGYIVMFGLCYQKGGGGSQVTNVLFPKKNCVSVAHDQRLL